MSYQITLFQWKKIIIVAERKHQCVASQKLSVETQLQKEPVVVFTHTVVYPEKQRRNKEPLVRCPCEDHEGKPQPKSPLFKTHIYSAFCKSQQPARRESSRKRSSHLGHWSEDPELEETAAQRARRTSLCTPALT